MLTIKRKFVYELDSKYRGEQLSPSGIVEEIREFEEDNGVKFSKIHIDFGEDASWSDHGYMCYEYDCLRSYECDELPEELDTGAIFAGIYYDESDNYIAVEFYGDGMTKVEREEAKRYKEHLRQMYNERKQRP